VALPAPPSKTAISQGWLLIVGGATFDPYLSGVRFDESEGDLLYVFTKRRGESGRDGDILRFTSRFPAADGSFLPGTLYGEQSDHRSWAAMTSFLEDVTRYAADMPRAPI
jgi:hypothetical protein